MVEWTFSSSLEISGDAANHEMHGRSPWHVCQWIVLGAIPVISDVIWTKSERTLPRFTIRTVLLVTFAAAMLAAYLNRPTPIERVREILNSGTTDAKKLQALSKFISLGDHEDDIDARLSSRPDGSSCGFIVDHKFFDCGLELTYRLDGTLCYIGYNVGDGTGGHVLATSPVLKDLAK